ncbi:MAG: winged helix DNA-binding protein, partial [Anaerolineales bacterium]|nr:winged helix DNA-binding protein [Anaerolineales bacterium]
SRNTMSAFIRNLEEDELVERHLDPHDRRRFNICLTDKGRALVEQHTRTHLETVDHCFSTLDSAEQQTLFRLLQKLGEHLHKVNHSD